MTDAGVKFYLEHCMGSIRLESRMRPDGNRIIGEGRCIEIDKDGHVVRASPWEQTTNIVLDLPPPEPRQWWRFWA